MGDRASSERLTRMAHLRAARSSTLPDERHLPRRRRIRRDLRAQLLDAREAAFGAQERVQRHLDFLPVEIVK